MTNTNPNRSLGATTAIAAVLALGSTPVIAQEAAPSLDLPQSVQMSAAPAPTADPVITLPDTTSPVATPTQPRITLPDVTSAQPAATQPERTAATTAKAEPASKAPVRTAAAAPAPRAPVASTDSEPTTSAPVTSAAQDGALASADAAETAGTAPALASAATPDTQVAATPAEPKSGNGLEFPDEALAGLLGVVGLGAAGFLATRSRRRRRDDDVERPRLEPVSRRIEPREFEDDIVPVTGIPSSLKAPRTMPAMQEADIQPAPAVASTTEPPVRQTGPAVAYDFSRAPKPATGARGAIPDGPVPTGEARLALLDRMVAAKPDADNPFTSAKARRKRSRMMLQHRERMLRENATEPFDYRTYQPTGANSAQSENAAPALV